MKTLEQTLEELRQIEKLVSSGNELNDDQVKEIINQLESSYDLAYGELEKMEEESLKIMQQDEE